MTQREPCLLTPGPLTTSPSVKQAMLRDWGSWDDDFNGMTADICQRLLAIAGGKASHVCIPMQGSGSKKFSRFSADRSLPSTRAIINRSPQMK